MVAMNLIEELGQRIGSEFGAEKVDERLQMGDHFMRDIIEKGKVLYESDRN